MHWQSSDDPLSLDQEKCANICVTKASSFVSNEVHQWDNTESNDNTLNDCT